ncbi:hypothetical protein B0H14DRAFT_2596231 [Mycena olivaceomarginata]|nr:hypothetical protein B0H14DRAFT_2596231 [Mycena olivaceomarginata]
MAVVGTEGGADEQGGDPVYSSRTAGGRVVREDAGSKETALAGKGDGGVRRCSGYGQVRGTRDAGGRYGDTEVWARLPAESSGGVWAQPRAGASVVGWGGRSDRGVEAAVGRRGGRVIAKLDTGVEARLSSATRGRVGADGAVARWGRDMDTRRRARLRARERDATVGWMGEGRACRHGGRGRGGMGWAWQHAGGGREGGVEAAERAYGEDAAARRDGTGVAAHGRRARQRCGRRAVQMPAAERTADARGDVRGRGAGRAHSCRRRDGQCVGGGSGYVVVEGVREGQEWRLRSMRGGSVGTVVPWRVRRGTGRGAGRGRWWSRWAGHGGRTSRRGRAGSARRGLGSGTGRQYGKRSTQCGRSSWRESGVEGGRRKARGLGSGVGTGWDTRAESRQQRGGTGGAWQRGRGWERRGGDRRGPAPRTLDARSGVMQLRRGGRRGRRGRHGGRHWERLLGATAVAMSPSSPSSSSATSASSSSLKFRARRGGKRYARRADGDMRDAGADTSYNENRAATNVRLGGTKKVQPHEVEVARGNRGAAESPRDTSRRCRARTQGFRGAGEHDKRRWPSIRAQYTEGVQLKQWNLRSAGDNRVLELEPATKETNETSSSAEARAGVTRNVPERTGFEAQSTQHNREGVGIGLQPARAVKRSMKTGRSTYLRTEPSTPSNCPNAESWGASWLLGQRSDTLSTVLEDIPFQRALLGSAAAKSTQAGSQGYAEDQLQRRNGGSLSFGRRRRGGGLNHAVETGCRGSRCERSGCIRDDGIPNATRRGRGVRPGRPPRLVKSAGSPGPREKDLGQSAGDGARRARTRPTWATMERVEKELGKMSDETWKEL